MTNRVSSHDRATLDMPFPRLSEGRFSSYAALTDDALYEKTGVRIAFTQRTGGVSEPPFDSFNLGGHVGDDPACVSRNRDILLEGIGAPDAFVIQPNQVHGDRVVVCERRQDVETCSARAREGADGVVVRASDVAAILCFADCVPIIAVSPAGSFAVVHAGWRGVVAHIAEKAVDMLCAADGVDASAVNVYIGAHIEACCFEVGENVAARFANEFGACALARPRHVDMTAALVAGLASHGVDTRRIACAHVCTMCDSAGRYYSYRRSAGVCGRHAAAAVRVSQDERSGASCRSNDAMPL